MTFRQQLVAKILHYDSSCRFFFKSYSFNFSQLKIQQPSGKGDKSIFILRNLVFHRNSYLR